MIEAFQALLRVQELDAGVRTAEKELASFAALREQAALAEAADQAAIEEARAALREAEQSHRRLEQDLAAADALVKKLDLQIYEVTSKQAMEAIQKETAAARQSKSQLEDAILELLDAIETDAEAVQAAGTRSREQASSRADAEAERSERERALRAEVEALGKRRAALVGTVDEGALREYESARRKAWPVLVQVEARSCPACHITIAPQKMLDIAKATSFVTCGSCHRIFYGEKVAAAG